ncbi:MAG: hypothetical protein JWO11_450 [Nocardioides sp.]|nr:hypothetical protein [Nocardioides sp.]
MQLMTVLTRAGAARWLLLVVPLVAVVATIGLTFQQEPDRSTLATVSVVAPEGQSTAATVSQSVDSFRSAIVSESVVESASNDAGVAVSASRDISATRIGTSNLVDITVHTQAGEDAEALIRALVSNTNAVLFSSTLTAAETRAERAAKRYETALKDRASETHRSGLVLPIESYRAKASEVTQLRVALATTLGDPAVDRAALVGRLAEAVRVRDAIGANLETYESVQDAVVRTRAEQANAALQLDAVQTRKAAATSSESVTISDTHPQSRQTLLVRAGVAALVVGLGVGAGLVLAIGLLREGRRNRNGVATPDPPAYSLVG